MSFGHAEFVMSIRYPSTGSGHTNLEFGNKSGQEKLAVSGI